MAMLCSPMTQPVSPPPAIANGAEEISALIRAKGIHMATAQLTPMRLVTIVAAVPEVAKNVPTRQHARLPCDTSQIRGSML
ncbi:hypothetical protein ColKHC_08941 [Colletotrichum higginsianum]|nr:hypothetical protein ColKHC_08941 [Colletotrichum higginsianum]